MKDEQRSYRERLTAPQAVPYVQKVIYFDSTDSTNERAKADIRAGKTSGGALYVADMQTAGKGRTGRGFMSPAGTSIYMSLTVCEKLSPEAFPLLTLVAALAVSNAIDSVCGVRSCIKWPNDILVANAEKRFKKVTGILTEAVGTVAVIGIGINVNNREFPAELEHAGSLFTVTHREYDRAAIVYETMKEFAKLIPELVSRQDISFMKGLYEAKLISLNRQVVTVPLENTLSDTDTVGYRSESDIYTCLGMDGHGALILADESGRETKVSSGEVSLRGLNGYID